MNRIKRITARIIALLCLVGLGIGWYGFSHIAPYAIIKPYRVHEDITPEDANLKGERFSFQTKDSLTLKGYWISATDSAKATIILLHGVGSCKEHFFGLAKQLANWGYNSVIFDGRAHGESQGQFCTYGYYEKYDVQQLFWLAKQKYPNQKIGIWGNSLGGAIALQSLDLEQNLAFGIIESTFSSLSQVVFDYKKRLFRGFGIRFLSDYALARAGEIGNFDPNEVNPTQSATEIYQPVFMAHGKADRHIGIENGRKNFEALSSEEKQFVAIPKAGHIDLIKFGGDVYRQQIKDFLESQVK